VIKQINPTDGKSLIANLTSPAFAISYPFGLLGVILSMVLVRVLFRADPSKEAELAQQLEHPSKAPLPAVMNIELKNPNLDGLSIARLADLQGRGVVISRVLQSGKVSIARPDTTVRTGDVVLAVGPQSELEEFRLIAGTQSTTDLRAMPCNITVKEILVTHREALGKTLEELDLTDKLGVNITRIRRGTVEFAALGNRELKFGDRVLAVGEASALDQAARELGNSTRELNHPRLLPIFIGLVLGVTLGAIPVAIPGLPVPVKLGLAAGPMIVAIVLARIGRVGGLIWYMPHSASQLMREFGITLFLICVGILAGDGFFNNLNQQGLMLLLLGAVITMVPLMLVGLFARIAYKTNYLHICGMLAGSMTSPSLAFTQTMTPSEAPSLAFATVYPLTMIMRVLMGQLLVLIFAGL
jgi:putative transport protein